LVAEERLGWSLTPRRNWALSGLRLSQSLLQPNVVDFVAKVGDQGSEAVDAVLEASMYPALVGGRQE
jgi:hypothetical protein